jgi:hypothetical protein
VVAGAATVVLAPSTAWAAPSGLPVDHYFSAGYHATAEFQLPDGREVRASLSENRSADQRDRRGFLSVDVLTPCAPAPCASSTASGSTDLPDEEVTFDRGLRAASVENVLLTLTTPPRVLPGPGLPPGGSLPPVGSFPPVGYLPPVGGPSVGGPPTAPYTPPVMAPAQTEQVTVTLEFTGTGSVDRSAGHEYTDCSDTGMCQSTRLSAARSAHAVLALVHEDGGSDAGETDEGSLSFQQGVDNGGRLPAGTRSN